MKLKEKLALEKERMRPYQYKFIYKFFLPAMLAVLALAIPVIIVCACWLAPTYGDEDIITMIPIMIWGGIMAAVLIPSLVISFAVINKRLLSDQVAEFEQEFFEIPLEEAVETLRESDTIDKEDTGFLYCDEDDPFGDEFGDLYVAYEDCKIIFSPECVNKRIRLMFVLLDKNDEFVAFAAMNNALYNLMIAKDIKIVNRSLFELFGKDKRAFCKKVFLAFSPFGRNVKFGGNV